MVVGPVDSAQYLQSKFIVMPPMREWPPSERPRERLLVSGPRGLTDAELLAVIIGSGSVASNALAIGRALLKTTNGLNELMQCHVAELTKIPGVGLAKACAVVATGELSRRIASRAAHPGIKLNCSQEVFELVRAQLLGQTQEVFLALGLDCRNRLITMLQVAKGSATSVEVHPREVFAPMVRASAAAVIVAHNHPSGDPEPSPQDRQLTFRLQQAGKIVGVPLLDHLVVGDRSFVSLAEQGNVGLED
ncbi:MAG: DNA repair protein RadC [Pseudomonadota bacterium]